MIMKNKILLMIIIVLFIGGYGVFFSLVNAKPISDLALTYESLIPQHYYKIFF